MPFVFPRRVLRARDVLVPREMTEDLQAAHDLLVSGLDRHNFCGARMKENLEHGESGFELPDSDSSVRYVASFAYHKLHTAASESFYIMDRGGTTGEYINRFRSPPNFVEPDGITFRDDISLVKNRPYIIPHTGEWSTVTDGRSGTSPLKLSFTTEGQKTLWLCAYLQYIWQGFYEFKFPWIGKDEGEDVQNEFTGRELSWSDNGWDNEFRHEKLARSEAEVFNHFGPELFWDSYLSESNSAFDGTGSSRNRYPYAFPLNELSAKAERSFPNLGGSHHISRGFYPALVQFALRVDGKIIEESITGKHHSFEESAHGTQVDASPVYRWTDKGVSYNKRFGQRENASGAYYGKVDSKTGGAGQKLSQSRATSCGPEVMPVRIGAVVPLTSGNHTVEIVARRLERKRRKFSSGDFVGVFSRRLVGIELTKTGSVSDNDADSRMIASSPSFETEDVLKDANIKDSRLNLATQLNSIYASEIKPHSLPNTHLPTKVEFAQSVSITGEWERQARTGLWKASSSMVDSGISEARFPGFQHASHIDKVRGFGTAGWGSGVYDDGAGWEKIRSTSVEASVDYQELSIVSNELAVTGSKNHLLLMADIEVKWIRGLLSKKAEHAFLADDNMTHNSFTSYLQSSKYLDLFALFAIGYRTGSDPSSGWTIASQHAPAMVNSFNWVNRSSNFLCDRTEGDVKMTVLGDEYEDSSPDYSFAKDVRAVDRRGANTLTSNMGCNIPLMLTIESTTPITEVAVFVSTTFPDVWSDDTAVYGDSMTPSGSRTTNIAGGVPLVVEDQWISPALGRGILEGVEVSWGNCSLSALKLHE